MVAVAKYFLSCGFPFPPFGGDAYLKYYVSHNSMYSFAISTALWALSSFSAVCPGPIGFPTASFNSSAVLTVVEISPSNPEGFHSSWRISPAPASSASKNVYWVHPPSPDITDISTIDSWFLHSLAPAQRSPVGNPPLYISRHSGISLLSLWWVYSRFSVP